MTSEVSNINGDVNNWADQKTQVIEVLGEVIEKGKHEQRLKSKN